MFICLCLGAAALYCTYRLFPKLHTTAGAGIVLGIFAFVDCYRMLAWKERKSGFSTGIAVILGLVCLISLAIGVSTEDSSLLELAAERLAVAVLLAVTGLLTCRLIAPTPSEKPASSPNAAERG